MALITNDVPNMIGGVSQQPDSMRLVNQCEAQENAISNAVEGLTKRPPTEHIKELLASPNDNLFIHHVNRDVNEQYFVVCDGDNDATTLKVFQLDGTEVTVNYDTESGAPETAQSYLTTTNPRNSLKATTIGDVTFLVNTEKTVGQNATLSTYSRGLSSPPNEALIVVKRSPSDFSKCNLELKVGKADSGLQRVGGSTDFGSGTSAGSGLDAIKTADRVVATLNGNSFDDDGDPNTSAVTLTATNNSLNVVHVTGNAPFTLTASDGQGGTVLKVLKDSVTDFTDLPENAIQGMKFKVEGNPESDVDDYYVVFEADDPTITDVPTKGRWLETTPGGLKNAFDFTTLPHILVRGANGQFFLTQADGSFEGSTTNANMPNIGQFKFQPRSVGDETTNPNPSFVGAKISNIAFFKNRLVFLTGENVVMSEVGEYFNFFRTTITSLPDSEVIDAAVGGSVISNLKQAVPFAGRLILFSDTSQFSLQGEQNLSPLNVSIVPQTGFEITTNAEPVVSGANLFFGFPRGDFNGIKQFFKVNEIDVQFDAVEVTAQVPKYIKGNITHFAATTHENMLMAVTDNDPGAVYAYIYYEAEGQRQLSSWSKFLLGDLIYSIFFIDTTMFLLLKRDNKLVLEKMKMETGLVDTGSTYVTRLDRRVAKTGTYDAATNKTNFTAIGYTPSTTSEAVTATGLSLTVTDRGAGTLSVQGDFSGQTVYLGEPYTMRYEFSKPILKSSNFRGSQVVYPSTAGNRYQIRYMTLVFSETAFFEVKVTPEYREATSYVFTGRQVGDSSSTSDVIPRVDGDFRVPVYGQADRIKIELVNSSHLPSEFQAAQFEGEFTSRRAAQR